MSGSTIRAFDPAMVSEEARRLYFAILHGTRVEDDCPALRELVEFGLVVPYPHGQDGVYLALDPREAGQTRRERLIQQAAGAMAEAAALPGRLRDLEIAYQITAPEVELQHGAVEYVEGVEPINARISRFVASCRQEMLLAQPDGPRPAETLAMSQQRDRQALQRGVRVRTLYHASVRADSVTARWAAEMTAEGLQLRTLDERFTRALIFDRRMAVVQDYTPWDGPGEEPRRALIVHDEGLAQYVAQMFDRDWSRGAVWNGAEAALDQRLTDLQKSIMRHLATGASQSTVAAELDVSTRTIQNELNKMRLKLGFASTTQMAYALGRQEALGSPA